MDGKWCFERKTINNDVKYCLHSCEPMVTKKYKLGNYLGKGTFGTVYDVLINNETNNGSYVVKAIPLDVIIPTDDCDVMDSSTFSNCEMFSEELFWKEANYAKLFGSIGVGPSVLDIIICNETLQITEIDKKQIKMGIIVMEKIGITLLEYAESWPYIFEENLPKILSLAKKKGYVVESNGYFLFDMHEENVLVVLDLKKNVKDLYFIDFGDVEDVEDEAINKEKTFNMFSEHMANFVKYQLPKIKTNLFI